MNAVAFDNTMLSILLNPNGRIPPDPVTGAIVEFAKERAESVLAEIQKSKSKIIIPAPALAELLTVIGPTAEQYINLINSSQIFEIAAFDARCASELAFLNRNVFSKQDKRSSTEAYQKIKIDRQILAICKVNGVSKLYTDDSSLKNSAKLCEITPIGISEVPIAESDKQQKLNLQQI